MEHVLEILKVEIPMQMDLFVIIIVLGFPGIIIEHAYISNQNDATSFLGWYDCIRTTYSRK